MGDKISEAVIGLRDYSINCDARRPEFWKVRGRVPKHFNRKYAKKQKNEIKAKKRVLLKTNYFRKTAESRRLTVKVMDKYREPNVLAAFGLLRQLLYFSIAD